MKLSHGWSKKWRRISSLALFAVSLAFSGESAIAQSKIVPDASLGDESSQVKTNLEVQGNPAEVIEGGAQRGINLFHSFEEFNVENGRGAYFSNPTGIENIFNRVTGANPSEILGTLGVSGNANLFLINPNGIIFGENARLDVGGSFVASTASSLKFADGNQFSATAPQTTPLLTVSVPLGLQFGSTAESIVNQSKATNISGEPVGLQVQPGKTLALVGGNVRLESTTMLAPGGRVELGGVSGSGTVEFVDSSNLRLSFPDRIARADVALTNGTFVGVAAGGGGDIAINAQNIDVLGGSYLFAGIDSGLGSGTAVAGDVKLNATGAIALKQSSNIINEVSPNATGNSGNIDIKAESLDFENALLNASTFGVGNGGTININARNTVSFVKSTAFSQVEPEAVGNSGGINITTGTLSLTDGAVLRASTKGQGNAGTINITARERVSFVNKSLALSEVEARDAMGNSGDINITTESLSLTDGSVLATSTFGQGNGATININARDSVSFAGKSTAFSQVESEAIGNSGGINITTGTLSLTDGAVLRASTKGQGNAGTINITARERVSFVNKSLALSEVEARDAMGNSGDINITTESLSLTDGSVLATSTFGQGNGATININARDSVSFAGKSTAFSQVEPEAIGNSGGINITAGSLFLTNSELLAHTKGQGNAGTININARDTISLAQSSKVLSEVIENQAVGNSGGININTGSLFLTDGSFLAASTFGVGNGGTININARDRISLNGRGAYSQVEPEAIGNSGGINITTGSLFLTNSELLAHTKGKGNAGTININARDTISLDQSRVLSEVIENQAVGNSGGINITTGSLFLTNGAVLAASTFGVGNGGTININARDRVSFDGSKAFSQVQEQALGNSGGIDITTGSLFVTNGAELITSTFGQGNAGNLTINARDRISLDGGKWEQRVFLSSKVQSRIEEGGQGQGGNIYITTGSLRATNGAFLNTSTDGVGNAGTINLNARDIYFAGKGEDNFRSGVYSRVLNYAKGQGGNIQIKTDSLSLTDSATISTQLLEKAEGQGGNIYIRTGSLSATNGASLSATTFGVGNAGNVTINARDIYFAKGSDVTSSGIYSQVLDNAKGQGGDIQIATKTLSLTDGAAINARLFAQAEGQGGDVQITADSLSVTNDAEVNVSSEGRGNAGNLDIKANSIGLDQGKLRASTTAGTGGNITLSDLNLLLIRDRSLISAEALNDANGGNITINAKDGFIVAVPSEDSDIIANAVGGNGGNIDITASGIFGLRYRDRPTLRTSDINASSEFGVDGTVEINTPDIDPSQGLVSLPTVPVDTEVAQACTPGGSQANSEFVVKGSGGLPPSPEDALDSDAIEVDWVTRPPQNRNSPKITNPISDKPAPIVEAQGWMVDRNNEIVLVADNPNNTWQNSPQCQKKAAQTQNLKDATPQLGYNPNQNILIASAKTTPSLVKVPERINVNRFEVIGNKVFESQELTEVLAPFTDKPLSFSELLQARSAITEYYTKRGYITSGAYIPRQRLQDKVVKIQIVEGYLEGIEITGNKRLNSNYFSRRIETATDSVQQEKLLAALQLLQQDPLITSISAELEAGTHPGASVLAVEVKEADSFKTPISFDNRRTPSVGSLHRQLAINEGNLLGFGDNLFLAYSNTEGSDAFDGSYTVPFNAHNGTITVSGGLSSSKVVEEPFNQLNILGDSHYYELSLRQPLIQTPTQEFALGITASRRDSNISSLLEEFDVPPSKLSPGADESGQTRVSALRFFQEWSSHNSREVIAARSQFNLGLNAFDATVNEDAPDSRFLAWQGQAQWVRQLAPNTSFLLRGGIQLATTSLLSSEQFGLGGLETLRGYRQDLLLTDNAAFASAEIRLPIFRINQIDSVFQLAPFFDVGTAWNNGEQRDGAETNTLASIGLGLRLLFNNNFTARLDWGIPLISVNSEKKTWQENGLYFSLEYSPF